EKKQSIPNVIFVKKWVRTKHAILFRLSNKIVQVCFMDRTEIILSAESKIVIYVNKHGEKLFYSLSSALESPNSEMVKRLKYTKDILTHMLSQGHGVSAGVKNIINPNTNHPEEKFQMAYYEGKE